MKVFELVSAAIAAEGCRAVFGLVGDGNLALWGALDRDGQVPLYTAWHDGAAVAMADAYARSCGEVGVATVTCGPGLTHAATSLITAVRHGSPLVLIVGDLPASDIGGNQQLDQRGFAQACGARFQNVATPERAADAIRAAFHDARLHSCPVVLNLPMDVLESRIAPDVDYHPAARVFAAHAPDPGGIDAIADLIAHADLPVLVAGRGAADVAARGAIIALADRIGAALGTSLLAKDCFAGHPRNIGIIGGIARGATRRLLAEADLVIAFGASLGYHTTDKATQLPRASVVRINTMLTGDQDGPPSAISLQADAGAAARALSDTLERRQIRKTGFAAIMVQERFRAAPWPDWPAPSDGMDPRRVMREIAKVLPPHVQVACGIGHFWSFPIMYLDLPEGGSFHSTHAFGAIGLGLPFGMGLAVAAPQRPVLTIEGDGSLMQALPELEAGVRQGLSLVVLTMNDGGYGAEAHKMAAKGFHAHTVRWPSPDFAALAKHFGGSGVRVEKEENIAAAVRDAFEVGGVHMIDARVSPNIMSDLYQKNIYGKAIE